MVTCLDMILTEGRRLALVGFCTKHRSFRHLVGGTLSQIIFGGYLVRSKPFMSPVDPPLRSVPTSICKIIHHIAARFEIDSYMREYMGT